MTVTNKNAYDHGYRCGMWELYPDCPFDEIDEKELHDQWQQGYGDGKVEYKKQQDDLLASEHYYNDDWYFDPSDFDIDQDRPY